MIRVDVVRIGVYCESCFRWLRYGREAGPCGGIEWIAACYWCLHRQRSKRAEVERLREMWSARECEAPGCSVVFTPGRAGGRFCSDRCRKRAHRLKVAGSMG
jgi:hypothetical protein